MPSEICNAACDRVKVLSVMLIVNGVRVGGLLAAADAFAGFMFSLVTQQEVENSQFFRSTGGDCMGVKGIVCR